MADEVRLNKVDTLRGLEDLVCRVNSRLVCMYVARVVKETRLHRISRILEPFFFILEISRFSRIKKTREIQHHYGAGITNEHMTLDLKMTRNSLKQFSKSRNKKIVTRKLEKLFRRSLPLNDCLPT